MIKLFSQNVLLSAIQTQICISVGGLAAVIYTDALQTLIMVGGALSLMFMGKMSTPASHYMLFICNNYSAK